MNGQSRRWAKLRQALVVTGAMTMSCGGPPGSVGEPGEPGELATPAAVEQPDAGSAVEANPALDAGVTVDAGQPDAGPRSCWGCQ